MEAAAYLSSEDRAASVTVVGNTKVPFERSLGQSVGERIQKLFEENGVKFVNEVNVTEFRGEDGEVKEVRVIVGFVTTILFLHLFVLESFYTFHISPVSFLFLCLFVVDSLHQSFTVHLMFKVVCYN